MFKIPHRWMTVLLVVQIACAGFFIFDAITDWLGLENSPGLRHVDTFEAAVAFALVAGVIATLHGIRLLRAQNEALKTQVNVASGAFSQVIAAHFEGWKLTTAERDIAMLSLKGFSTAEMADIRNTKEGTIKAHSAAIYRKAGVSGRHQLLSLFVEELMDGSIIEGDRQIE